jgi:hypothetical protein
MTRGLRGGSRWLGAALLAALTLLGPAAAAAPSEPPIRVQSFPPQMVLGVDARARLEIATDRDLELSAFASVGRIVGLQRVSPRSWTATYLPPATRAPQVAILAFRAKDESGPTGFAVVPLFGTNRLEVVAGPRSKVSVRVAGVSLLPVPADRHGKAVVPVRVPPGTRHGWLTAVDRGGRETRTRIDLKVPPFKRVMVLPHEGEVVADGRQEVRLTMVAVDPKGRPAAGLLFNVAPSAGSATPVEDLGGGVYATTFTPAVRTTPGRASVTVWPGDDRASADTLNLSLKPITARRFVRASLQPARLVADGRVTALLSVVLDNGRGIGIPGETLRLEASGGVVTPFEDRGRGRYVASYTPPRLVAVTSTQEVVAQLRISHLPKSGRSSVEPLDLPVQLTVPSETGGPGGGTTGAAASRGVVRALIRTQPDPIRADGKQQGEIQITLRDVAGAPLAQERLVVEVRAGEVAGLIREVQPGLYSVPFRAPRFVTEARTPIPVVVLVTNEARDFLHQTELTVESATAADLAPGGAGPPRWLVGAHAGVALSLGNASGAGPAVGLELGYRLPIFDRNLFASLSFALLFPEGDADLTRAPQPRAFAQQWVMPSMVGFRYRRELTARFDLAVGVEVGIVLADLALGGRLRGQFQRDLLVGIQVPVGLEVRVGPGVIPFEVRFLQSFQQREIPAGGVAGTLRALGFSTGYRVPF